MPVPLECRPGGTCPDCNPSDVEPPPEPPDPCADCTLHWCACAYAHVKTGRDILVERCAVALNWPWHTCNRMSFHTLRDLVRTVDPALSGVLSEWIRTGKYITGG